MSEADEAWPIGDLRLLMGPTRMGPASRWIVTEVRP